VKPMKTCGPWSRILIIAGGIAMLVGALDPLEGSLIILPGSGLVALGTFLGHSEGRIVYLNESAVTALNSLPFTSEIPAPFQAVPG
jgi:hypothetical protein